MLNVGVFYERAWGTVYSPRKAVQWYEKAAENGVTQAVAYLGECYVTGKGVDKDVKKGISLLEQAAKKDVDYAKKVLYEIDSHKYYKYKKYAQ
jgi:TPR repeat protein